MLLSHLRRNRVFEKNLTCKKPGFSQKPDFSMLNSLHCADAAHDHWDGFYEQFQIE